MWWGWWKRLCCKCNSKTGFAEHCFVSIGWSQLLQFCLFYQKYSCLFLLNDSFRALYKINLDGLQELSNQIIQVYRIAQPVLAGICAFLSAIVLIVIIRNQDEAHKTRKIVSVSLSVLIVLIATLVYYMKLI